MNRANDLFYYPELDSVNSNTVIEVFANKMEESKYSLNGRYTVVMVDNASIHTRHKFKSKIADWMIDKKWIICFLPAYSSELNLIEML